MKKPKTHVQDPEVNPATGTAAAPPPAEGKLEQIELSEICESLTNPRKTFVGIKELADSIRQQGVAQPILVRPNPVFMTREGKCRPEKYELVDGARRFRASKEAGLTTIPAMIRDIDDKTALELQFVANDQREDVSPMEQARGYQLAIDRLGYSVADLAKKLSRDQTYVYQRLQLVKLIKPLVEAVDAGKLDFAHARELSRMNELDQKELLNGYHRERILEGMISVRDLQSLCAEYRMELKDAAFPKDLDCLGGARPACIVCPKRTGLVSALWPEIGKGKDQCIDRHCFEAKKAAWVDREKIRLAKEAPGFVQVAMAHCVPTEDQKRLKGEKVVLRGGWKEVPASKADAKGVVPALVVSGEGAGRTIHVKLNEGKSSHPAKREKSPEVLKWEARQNVEAERNALRETIDGKVLDAILGKVKTAPGRKELALLVGLAWNAANEFDDVEKLLARKGLAGKHGYKWAEKQIQALHEKADAAGLFRELLEMALLSLVGRFGNSIEQFAAVAKHFNVDRKPIEKQVIAEARQKKEAQKKAKAEAKKIGKPKSPPPIAPDEADAQDGEEDPEQMGFDALDEE